MRSGLIGQNASESQKIEKLRALVMEALGIADELALQDIAICLDGARVRIEGSGR